LRTTDAHIEGELAVLTQDLCDSRTTDAHIGGELAVLTQDLCELRTTDAHIEGELDGLTPDPCDPTPRTRAVSCVPAYPVAAMLRLPLLATLAFGLLLPTTSSADPLPAWLADRAEDAQWLTEKGENPRALINLWPSGVEVVIYLPGLDTADVVSRIERYDIWNNTDMVESALCTDGAFFTGTRVRMAGLSAFSPTITSYRKDVRPEGFTMSWTLLNEEDSNTWLTRNKDALAQMLTQTAVDVGIDDYLEEVRDKIGGVSSVEGSHTYEGGYYRYMQEIHSRSKVQESLVRSFGQGPQLRAALKSALFSAGRVDLAGKAGDKGVEFDVRGASQKTVKPGT